MPETKKKVVPLSERETIITYNDAEKTANVYTMNRKLSRKLLAMAQEYPRVHEEVMKERQDIALRSLYLCLLACYQVGLKPSTLVKIQNAMSGPVTEKYSSYRVDQLADTWAQVTLQNIGVDVAETGEQL